MSDDVLLLLKRKIRAQMNDIADHLALGSAQDREIIDIEDRLKEL